MDKLYSALGVSYTRNRRFVVASSHCDETCTAIEGALQDRCGFAPEDVITIDLSQHESVLQMVLRSSHETQLCNAVIWRNVHKKSQQFQRQLAKLLAELDGYDLRGGDQNEYAGYKSRTAAGVEVFIPSLFSIVLVVDIEEYHSKIHPALKSKFWFVTHHEIEETTHRQLPSHVPFQDLIRLRRDQWSKIYVSPMIKGYIYSLIVQMRTHRLTGLLLRGAGLTTRSLEAIEDLAIALVVWSEYPDYVTPDHVQIAAQKVGYWLVEWETNETHKPKTANEKRIQMIELGMRAGDWYGCDEAAITAYLEESRPVRGNTPLGMTNRIVEDALAQVQHPL